MQFNYPHLSAGYLGIQSEKATLNSAFYAELFKNSQLMGNSIIFPQRVPRKEFFAEMIDLEGDCFSQSFKQIQTKLKNETLSAVTQTQKPRIILNYLHLVLRYGLSEIICNIDNSTFSTKDPSEFAEFKLIKEIANFQQENNHSNLNDLVKESLCNTALSTRVQIVILNYLIVAAARFNVDLPYKECLDECSDKLLQLIELELTDDFGNAIRQSIAYRGLAMVKKYGESLQNDFLNRAEKIARNISPTGIMEQILAKENLYTCLQTLSKWNSHRNQIEQTKSNLAEMIHLDPFDSTGYAEMAFFHLNAENYEEASHYFKLASEFGPPAVGMHTYYYGKCLQIIGKTETAIEVLCKSTTIDKEAVSPWLDLFEYYVETNHLMKTKEIASHLLTSPVFRTQLDQQEINKMQEFLT